MFPTISMLCTLGFIALSLGTWVWSVVWSWRDAKLRGKSAFLVALLVFFIVPFGFLAWLIFRPSQLVAPARPRHEKRWKWILALGAIGYIGTAAGIPFSLFSVMAGFNNYVRETPAFVEAMDRLHSNPAAIALLGEPIQVGMVTGSYGIGGIDGGNADLSIPVEGSKTSGILYLKARQSDGVWKLQVLVLEAGGERIDLLGKMLL